MLGYQNVAANHAAGPNAMLLHLPGAGMTPDNFVDTSRIAGILTDMTWGWARRASVGYGAAAAPLARAAARCRCSSTTSTRSCSRRTPR